MIREVVKGRMRRILAVVGVASLVVSAGFLYVKGIQETRSKFYSMCWLQSDAPITNLIEAYDYVERHSTPSDVIADQSYTEGIYYSGRETFWLRTSGGVDFYLGMRNHDEELVRQTYNKYHIRYLVLIERLITEEEPNTEQFLRNEDYLFIRDSSLFALVFDEPGVEVYRYEPG